MSPQPLAPSAREQNLPSSRGGSLGGYDFNYRVRGALIKARDEARRRHHEYVGTEHLLLGLLAEEDTLIVDVLENLGAKPFDLQTAVELMTVDGPASGRLQTPDLAYSPRARVVLDQAISTAHEFGDGYVGTQHLLLGLIREQNGVAARAMIAAGLAEPQLRREIARLLQGEGVAATIDVPQAQTDTQVPLSIAVEVHYGDGSMAKKIFSSKDEAIGFLRDKPRE